MTRQDDERNVVQVTRVISNYMLKHADRSVSINELCRACVDAGLSVSKPYVASIRRQVGALTLKRIEVTGNEVAMRVTVPAAVEQFALRANPDELARERDAKAQREAERAEKWRARQAEREAQWALERAQAAQQEAAQQEAVVVEQVNEQQEALEQEQANMTALAAEVGRVETVAEEHKGAPEAPKPPPKRRTAAMVAERRQFLNQLLDDDPGIDPVVALGRLREKFGSGLSNTYVYETCRIAREIHGLPTVARRNDEHGRIYGGREPLPTFEAPEGEEEFASTPEEDLAWLARQAGDIMRQHNLVGVTLTMSVAPVTGERSAEWEFEVAPRTGRGTLKF